MTYEEQYTKETGKHSYIEHRHNYAISESFRHWLENKLDIEHRRRVAAEELRDECVCCHDDNCKGCILLYNWQQTVTDYNKIIKEEGDDKH